MRFIQKTQSPDFFEQEKCGFPLTEDSPWGDFKNPCKKMFKDFLAQEQHGLCGYCERDLSSTSSHLEHIAPRERYKHLKFVYENLIVSCDGGFLCQGKMLNKESCGHRKDNEYDEQLFLNPVQLPDISTCFHFDNETGAIIAASQASDEAANYTIRILNLNAPYVRDARMNARDVLLEGLSNLPIDQAETILRQELSAEREFISFLRHYFAPFLGDVA
ncbi:retron system putative HNH endonuclease [Candidatus Thiothrix sp. Deng01]|uniref:Retron system putative HNH endonuclease n=1 Tax=Candidatus Thiothrix phosphatis TaxID=3112415 RepID=A0ABU6D1X7_9GAMM|nr:retron system putative HNH endonuclease [Candidatus Thiothrix sp. Deng01]MEB4592817.1 retron system putative HNH endonuclease [Candidatus Thiothrix sp. Deng01]